MKEMTIIVSLLGLGFLVTVLAFGNPSLALNNQEHRLFEAVAQNDVTEVQALAKEGVNINAKWPIRFRLNDFDLGLDLFGCHDGGGQKPKCARLYARAHQLRGGNPAHSGLNNRIFATEHFGQRRFQRVMH